MRALVLILCVLLTTPRLAAADDLAQAKTLYDQGLAHYNVAEYDAAITAWKEAYKLSKRPLLLFNIGQAYRLAGDCKQALTFYDSYRREESKPKPELEAAIAECANQPPAATPPAPQPPASAPPPIAFGPIPRLVGEPPSRGKRIAGIAFGSAGVAAAGAAVWFAYDSNRQSERLDNFTGVWGDREDAIERRGRRGVVLAYTFGIAGAASLVTGGVLLWLGRDQREVRMDIAPIRGGGTVATWTVPF